MTGDLKRHEVFYVGSGAPETGDQITANTSAYPIGSHYLDSTNGTSYVRTAVNKLTGDWTSLGSSASYSSYIAQFAQAGSSAPTPVVQNAADSNYLGAITWGRITPDSNVVYTLTKTGAFPDADKINILLTHDNWNAGLSIMLGWSWVDADTIYITGINEAGAYVDIGGTHNSIRIEVYT